MSSGSAHLPKQSWVSSRPTCQVRKGMVRLESCIQFKLGSVYAHLKEGLLGIIALVRSTSNLHFSFL